MILSVGSIEVGSQCVKISGSSHLHGAFFTGDDDNDFDNQAMAFTAFEDTYLTIRDVDGSAWVDKLRVRMHDGANSDNLPSEQSWLLSKIV